LKTLVKNKNEGLFCIVLSAIVIVKNPVSHERSKHISVKYNFIREAQEKDKIQLHYCQTREQLADIFTKALPREKICYIRERIEVIKQMH